LAFPQPQQVILAVSKAGVKGFQMVVAKGADGRRTNRTAAPCLTGPLCPAVTYEPPGKSGVEELQWLDSMSRPKVGEQS
jgi:hypothetical protein